MKKQVVQRFVATTEAGGIRAEREVCCGPRLLQLPGRLIGYRSAGPVLPGTCCHPERSTR